jgi:hypothetical protein
VIVLGMNRRGGFERYVQPPQRSEARRMLQLGLLAKVLMALSRVLKLIVPTYCVLSVHNHILERRYE